MNSRQVARELWRWNNPISCKGLRYPTEKALVNVRVAALPLADQIFAVVVRCFASMAPAPLVAARKNSARLTARSRSQLCIEMQSFVRV